MTVFTGKEGVQTFRAAALKAGIRLYIRTGMKPNRAWTITNMLRAAGEITGKKYKRGQGEQAMTDLEAWLEENGTAG
ncbi:MAG: hypothetical protein Tp138OMZ00d2C19078261_22 [Prokaryotic dsDNA virus sp.]|jgi:hypothetical protein|nr:MAG: hypothetical protein Tp138OMZ00d2C19078261_22 [Prokaryotic dsDNA virus sp.]|tara:strand:- start:18505 stop:18735 length:231 start_codon:yes stop_codon:yes gene_type:complete